jgi:hypothetical protein
MKTGETKMNARQDIIISSAREETLSWKRYIHFKYQDKEYSVLLFWDEFNGYEIYWKDKESELLNSHIAPEWAVNWDEDLYEGCSLAAWLDELTFEGTPTNANEDLFNELISSAEKLIQMTGEKKND